MKSNGNPLIPVKSLAVSLPPLTDKLNRSSQLSPERNFDFDHSLNSTPLSHKENVIPVKHYHDSVITPSKNQREIFSLDVSPIPDLTPPQSRMYDFDTPKTVRKSISMSGLNRSRSSLKRKVSIPSISRNNSFINKQFKSPLRLGGPRRTASVSSPLTLEINELTKNQSLLMSYKNLKLSGSLNKNQELISKWILIVRRLSQIVLARYQVKILNNHENYKTYKLAKFEKSTSNLKWSMTKLLDSKYSDMVQSEAYTKLSDYEKKQLMDEYEESRKQAVEEFNKALDEKFKQIFKHDILLKGHELHRYINSEEDVMDEFGMSDLYDDLKLNHELYETYKE